MNTKVIKKVLTKFIVQWYSKEIFQTIYVYGRMDEQADR
jgi:hypothetical protein